MTTYPIAELTGTQLDAAVLLARGAWSPDNRRKPGEPTNPVKWCAWACYSPSTWWGDGGPMIESEMIELTYEDRPAMWHAELEHVARTDGVQRTFASGSTPLIAACRAYATSKLGETVELP